MHYSTKTSKLAAYALAIGLTILIEASAVAPVHSLETAHITPLMGYSALSAAAVTTLGFASDNQSGLASVQYSVCDRCRTICARSCSSYACYVCDRSLRCRYVVESCSSVFRRR